MRHILPFLLPACGLGVAMLLLLEAGRRIGIWRRGRNPQAADKEGGAVEAAIFGLMCLLIAFTFSGAASRLDERRHMIVQEAKVIGTLRSNFSGADLRESSFLSANLGYADLNTANLRGSDLQGVNLANTSSQMPTWSALIFRKRT
jgi:hypothetical protein